MEAVAGGTVSFEMLDGVGGRCSVLARTGAETGGGAGVGRSFGIVVASFASSRSSCRVLSRVLMMFSPRARSHLDRLRPVGEPPARLSCISVGVTRLM